MNEKIVRIADYERRSREPDAVGPRNPVEADVIVLPVIRIERLFRPEPREVPFEA